MTIKRTINLSLVRLLNWIILFDLVFGGSGRLIMVGGLSFRTILFGISIILAVIYSLMGRVVFENKMFLLILLFVSYLVINVVAVGNKPISDKFDFLSRYLYILMVFFYDVVFCSKGGKVSIEEIRKVFESLTFYFAIFSIALWTLAAGLGGRSYQIIGAGFLAPRVYGNMDFISAGIPRIFLKSSILIAVGLVFHLDRFIDRPSSHKLFKCIVCGLALITTFTAGFFIATAICVLILLHKKQVMKKQIMVIFVAIMLVGIAVIARMGLLDIMAGRYSGDYSSSYRLIQFRSIIGEFFKSPIIGHGFGYEFTTVYGDTIRTTRNFEIAWGELLVDGGLIGSLLFVFIIGLTLRRIFKLSRIYQNNTLYVFGLGLVLICLESFTNPFINNSIGLTYFAICAGSINDILTQKRSIGEIF